MNRNWLKVLGPEAAVVILTLAIFFIGRYFGLEDEAAVAVAAAVAFAEEYKLPKFWVIVSYLAEAAAIFLPIHLFFNN